MAKIKSPNPNYNGDSASLHFVNGEADTDDKWLIEWFKNKGYMVEETAEKKKEKVQSEEKGNEAKKNSEQPKAKKSKDKKDE
ncbi:hypothetical protein [Cytobacillus oceanisediminis]|uniref:hypothetical protein n=1 Tax=Cytobacillus oceanisediminis TaxID=665099 RepID=UPI003736AF34